MLWGAAVSLSLSLPALCPLSLPDASLNVLPAVKSLQLASLDSDSDAVSVSRLSSVRDFVHAAGGCFSRFKQPQRQRSRCFSFASSASSSCCFSCVILSLFFFLFCNLLSKPKLRGSAAFRVIKKCGQPLPSCLPACLPAARACGLRYAHLGTRFTSQLCQMRA